LPLFSDFSPADLVDIVGQMIVRRFVAGEILLREGEFAGAVSVLVEGVVRILGKNGARKAIRLGLLGPGDIFGAGSVLRGWASPATLAAENPGELLVWPRAALDAICSERPRLRDVLEAFQSAASLQGFEAAVAKSRRRP